MPSQRGVKGAKVAKKETRSSENKLNAASDFPLIAFLEKTGNQVVSHRQLLSAPSIQDLEPEDVTRVADVFQKYCRLGAVKGALSGMFERAKTMDFKEFLVCMADFQILASSSLPRSGSPHRSVSPQRSSSPLAKNLAHPVTKGFLGALFRAVQGSGFGEGRELDLTEFRAALGTVAVHINHTIPQLLDRIEPEQNRGGQSDDGENETSIGNNLNQLLGETKVEDADLMTQGLGIRKEHLAILHKLFDARGGELSEDEFVTAFESLLNLRTQEVQDLFMRMDANGDRKVSWDEFSSYVLALSVPSLARDADVVLTDQVNPPEGRDGLGGDVWGEAHATTVDVATLVEANKWRPDGDKYVTCTKDGDIKVFYGSNAKVLRHEQQLRGAAKWVHCITALTQFNTVCFSSNDETLRFFSFEPRFREDIRYKTGSCQCHALCSFSYKPGSGSTDAPHISYLAWGDDVGRIHLVLEKDVMRARASKVLPVVKAEQFEKANDKFNYARQLFRGWVTAVVFVPDIGMSGTLVAASSGGLVVLFDHEERSILKRLPLHVSSVKAMTWCPSNRSMASGGLDRDVLIWDPKSGRRTGKLIGHNGPVIGLSYFDQNEQLFSLDIRYIILVWDMSKHQLVTRIDTDEGDPVLTQRQFSASFMFVNPLRCHLAIIGKKPYLWKIRTNQADDRGWTLHKHPLLATLYNTHFHQVVVIDTFGLITVWDMNTGQQTFSFGASTEVHQLDYPGAHSHTHITKSSAKESEVVADGDHVQVTEKEDSDSNNPSAAAFDPSERKLLVGFTNGRVQVYNFSNGMLLNTLASEKGRTTSRDASIVALVTLPGDMGPRGPLTKVFASGLESHLLQWTIPAIKTEDDVFPEKKLMLPSWRSDWGVDTSSIAVHKSGVVGTGRKDGHVLLWNVTTGFFKKDLMADIFRRIDNDGSGTLTYEEVSQYLREREKYTQDAIDDFCRGADRTGEGLIDKKEFQKEMDRRGVLEKIDPVTGEPIFQRREYYVEGLVFFKGASMLISGSADGWVSFMDTTTGTEVISASVIPEEGAMLTCIALAEEEATLLTGDSQGEVRLWNVKGVHASAGTKKLDPIEEIRGWQASEGPLLSVAWVERGQTVITTGQTVHSSDEHEHDGVTHSDTMVGSVNVWTIKGDLLGTFGLPDSVWGVQGEPGEGLLLRLKTMDIDGPLASPLAALVGKKALADGHQKETTKEMERAATLSNLKALGDDKLEAVEHAQKHRFRFPFQRRSVKGVLKQAGRVVLNKTMFRLAAKRKEEVDGRMARAKTFFSTRFEGQEWLVADLLERMKQVWETEVNKMSLAELESPTGSPRGPAKSHHERGGVRGVITRVVAELPKTKLALPPTAELIQIGQRELKRAGYEGTAEEGESEDGDAWIGLRALLTMEILQRKVEEGWREEEVIAQLKINDRVDAEQLNREFEMEFGASPGWEKGAGNVTFEERIKAMRVAWVASRVLGERKTGTEVLREARMVGGWETALEAHCAVDEVIGEGLRIAGKHDGEQLIGAGVVERAWSHVDLAETKEVVRRQPEGTQKRQSLRLPRAHSRAEEHPPSAAKAPLGASGGGGGAGASEGGASGGGPSGGGLTVRIEDEQHTQVDQGGASEGEDGGPKTGGPQEPQKQVSPLTLRLLKMAVTPTAPTTAEIAERKKGGKFLGDEPQISPSRRRRMSMTPGMRHLAATPGKPQTKEQRGMFLPLKERYALWADALERTQSASTAATAADAIKSGAPEQEGGGVEEAEAGEEKGGMREILARKMAKGGDQVTAIKSLRANDEDDDADKKRVWRSRFHSNASQFSRVGSVPSRTASIISRVSSAVSTVSSVADRNGERARAMEDLDPKVTIKSQLWYGVGSDLQNLTWSLATFRLQGLELFISSTAIVARTNRFSSQALPDELLLCTLTSACSLQLLPPSVVPTKLKANQDQQDANPTQNSGATRAKVWATRSNAFELSYYKLGIASRCVLASEDWSQASRWQKGISQSIRLAKESGRSSTNPNHSPRHVESMHEGAGFRAISAWSAADSPYTTRSSQASGADTPWIHGQHAHRFSHSSHGIRVKHTGSSSTTPHTPNGYELLANSRSITAMAEKSLNRSHRLSGSGHDLGISLASPVRAGREARRPGTVGPGSEYSGSGRRGLGNTVNGSQGDSLKANAGFKATTGFDASSGFDAMQGDASSPSFRGSAENTNTPAGRRVSSGVSFFEPEVSAGGRSADPGTGFTGTRRAPGLHLNLNRLDQPRAGASEAQHDEGHAELLPRRPNTSREPVREWVGPGGASSSSHAGPGHWQTASGPGTGSQTERGSRAARDLERDHASQAWDGHRRPGTSDGLPSHTRRLHVHLAGHSPGHGPGVPVQGGPVGHVQVRSGGGARAMSARGSGRGGGGGGLSFPAASAVPPGVKVREESSGLTGSSLAASGWAGERHGEDLLTGRDLVMVRRR